MVSDVRNMDCMEFMKQFPDKFFDLALAIGTKKQFSQSICQDTISNVLERKML